MRVRFSRGHGGRGVRGVIAGAFLLSLVVFVGSAFAQGRRDARLVVTVADQTGAVIPGATVKVDGP